MNIEDDPDFQQFKALAARKVEEGELSSAEAEASAALAYAAWKRVQEPPLS